jgi:hypothetical protein
LRRFIALMVAVLLLMTPTTAQAWGRYGVPLSGAYTHTFCINPDYGFPYQSMRDTVVYAVKSWNDLGGASFHWNLVADSYFGTSGCQYGISYAPIQESGNPIYAHTSPPTSAHAFTTINRDRGGAFFWYTSVQNCYTSANGVPWNGYPVCKIDGLTAFRHEAGHALGLGHNILPDQTYVLCHDHFYSTDVDLACYLAPTNLDSYAKNVMYWLAGDGYRRAQRSDDIGGLKSIYGILVG